MQQPARGNREQAATPIDYQTEVLAQLPCCRLGTGAPLCCHRSIEWSDIPQGCLALGFPKPLPYQKGLFCSAWLSMEGHNPFPLSARRVYPQYCRSEVARQIALCEFG